MLIPSLSQRCATPHAAEPGPLPDDRVSELESALDAAVSQEDYETAARLKKEIQDLLLNDDLAVRRANNAFYEAFSKKDLPAMTNLWAKDGAVCVHPSSAVYRGHASVIASWKEIFAASEVDISAEEVECTLLPGGRSAVVTCIERVAGPIAVPLFGSNVFKKDNDGQWRMVLHHATSRGI